MIVSFNNWKIYLIAIFEIKLDAVANLYELKASVHWKLFLMLILLLGTVNDKFTGTPFVVHSNYYWIYFCHCQLPCVF